jgi:hypothetical protein
MRKVLARLVAAAITMAAIAPATASATTASAFLDRSSCCFYWSGNAVGAYATWTYSWRIRLIQKNTDFGDIVKYEHIKENFRGTTSYSTPTYQTGLDFISPGFTYCTHFYLYHSTTVGNNRVADDEACRSY